MIRPPGPVPAHLAEVDLRRRGDLPGQRAGLDAAARRLRAGSAAGACWPLPAGVALAPRPAPPCAGVAVGGRGLRCAGGGWPSPRPSDSATFLGSSPFLARTSTRWPSATSSPAAWSMMDDRAVVVRLHRHRGLVGLDIGQRRPLP